MGTRKRLLIADDEFNTRMALERFFKRKYDISIAADGEEALALLEKESFDLVLTDLRMPRADGMSVLKSASSSGVPCVLLTAYGSINDAVQAVKLGAYDFVPKPVKLDQLEAVIRAALENGTAAGNAAPEAAAAAPEAAPEGIVLPEDAASPMKKICDTARTVAPSRASVLLCGESGTGKEVIAKLITTTPAERGHLFPSTVRL